MVLLTSEMVPLGTLAGDFSLKGIDENMHSLEDYSEKSALVIIFMCNHCPYVQAIWDEMNELQEEYGGQGVQLIGINPNASNPAYPGDSFEEMKKAPAEFGMNFPYLIDEDQEVSRTYSAVCTPDIFVYGASRTLEYRGNIEGVADALDAILDGEEVSEEQEPSQGCSIKWL